MTRTLLVTALATVVALPALAMQDMACKDFMAMDGTGRMEAMADTGGMMAAAPQGEAAQGMMAQGAMGAMTREATTAAAADACGMHPDMMVGAAMQAAH